MFYDEINAIEDGVVLLRDPRIHAAGGLDCIQLLLYSQWYLADGTPMEDTYAPHRIYTHYMKGALPQVHSRLIRTLKLYPRKKNHNGLWSCRPVQSGKTSVAFVGVYERDWPRRKLDGGLGCYSLPGDRHAYPSPPGVRNTYHSLPGGMYH